MSYFFSSPVLLLEYGYLHNNKIFVLMNLSTPATCSYPEIIGSQLLIWNKQVLDKDQCGERGKVALSYFYIPLILGPAWTRSVSDTSQSTLKVDIIWTVDDIKSLLCGADGKKGLLGPCVSNVLAHGEWGEALQVAPWYCFQLLLLLLSLYLLEDAGTFKGHSQEISWRLPSVGRDGLLGYISLLHIGRRLIQHPPSNLWWC